MLLYEYDELHKLHAVIDDNQYIVAKLLEILYDKTILKSKSVRRIEYKYNYTDYQTVIIRYYNKCMDKFELIPTQQGYLNITKLINSLKGVD